MWPSVSGERVGSCCELVSFQGQAFLLCPQCQAASWASPLSVSSPTGSMDTGITQDPGHLVKGKGQKAKMDCVPIKGHSYVYWYRQKLGEELKFLVYLQNEEILEKTDMINERCSAKCPKNSQCSLEIQSTEPGDSALYFCASSQSTVLNVSFS